MNKKQKQLTTIVLTLIVILIIFYKFGLPQLSILPTAGCQFIKSTSDPSSEFTKILDSSSFTCESDECIVSGVMDVGEASSEQRVVARTNIDLSEIDCGNNNYYCTSNSVARFYLSDSVINVVGGGTPSGSDLKIVVDGDYIQSSINGFFGLAQSGLIKASAPPGTETLLEFKQKTKDGILHTLMLKEYSGGNYALWVGDSGYAIIYSVVLSTGIPTDTTSIQSYASKGQEAYSSEDSVYSATFNLCPATDPNFAYCSGSKNYVSSSTPKTFYTEEKRLIRGDTLTFSPKYSDGSSVTKKYIQVKEYDCSCIPAVESGDACSSEQIYCKLEITAADRYLSNSGVVTNCKNGAYGSVGSSTFIRYCQVRSNTYQRCDATRQIGQATCGAFSTNTLSCPTGQQCYVSATGETGEGIGGCKCPNDPCILGQKIAVAGTNNQYQECISIGSCVGYSSSRTCAEGLIFDPVTSSCVCNPDKSCNPLESECVGDLIRRCSIVPIGDKVCYQWQNAQNCEGSLKCSSGECSCEGVETCNSGDIQCTSTTTYLTCSKDPNDVNSCLIYRDLGGTVGQFQQCLNNEIIQRQDVGCAYNTPGSECSQQRDSNNILIEQCINNECVSPIDDLTATESDFLSQRTRCSENTIQEVKKYTGNLINSYRWETKTNAQYSTLGVCKEDYLCVELLSGQATCGLAAQFVGIIAEEDYGINDPINNVLVSLTAQVPNRANMPITARLLENNAEISGTRINTFTDSSGMVTLNFNYQHPRSGKLTIDVVANPSGTQYKGSKEINILQTLNLKLNCPISGYTNTQVECSWKTENIDTGNLVSPDKLDIVVQQGGLDIPYNPIGTTGLSFKTQSIGSVLVQITSNKNGFISDTEEANIPINSLTTTQDFKIDNIDYFSNSQVSTGTHQLAIDVKDSVGNLQTVQTVTGTLVTPTGQQIPITFNKVSEGSYKAIANFPTAGQTYTVKGTITFPDVAKDNIPFEYSINTLGSKTEEEITNTIYLIIGGFIVLLFIIFIIIFAVIKKKR